MANNPINYIYFSIICMAFVTCFSKQLPFIVSNVKKLEHAIVEWLEYIPAAFHFWTLISELLSNGNGIEIDIFFANFYLITGILSFYFGFL